MFALELGGVREAMRRALGANYRMLAGLAYMALAMAAIHYDEVVAPGVNRLAGAWSSATADISRKLTFST